MPLDVARVHAVQIGGEDRGLVAAGASTDLDDRVAIMKGVGRQEQRLERFFRQRNGQLDPRDFGASLGRHLSVIERQELARLLELVRKLVDPTTQLDYGPESLVLPPERGEPLRVFGRSWIRELAFDLGRALKRFREPIAETQLSFARYFWRKRSMRPAVSMSFCFPVKKG